MGNFLRLAIFGLVLIGAYTVFSAVYVPDLGREGDGKRAAVTAESLTPALLADIGEEVYGGRGGCALCHEKVIGRAPKIDDIAITGGERLKAQGYRGAAADVVGYIYESMLSPSAYVVPGYGRAGTDDTVSPMPEITGGELGLTEFEAWAVIAYLQKKAGLSVTDEVMAKAREGL